LRTFKVKKKYIKSTFKVKKKYKVYLKKKKSDFDLIILNLMERPKATQRRPWGPPGH
jgi:hypothetical protein